MAVLGPQKTELSEKTLAIHQRTTESMNVWDDILHMIRYFSVLSQEKKPKPLALVFSGERNILLITKLSLYLGRKILGKLLCYCCFISICPIFCTVQPSSKFA